MPPPDRGHRATTAQVAQASSVPAAASRKKWLPVAAVATTSAVRARAYRSGCRSSIQPSAAAGTTKWVLRLSPQGQEAIERFLLARHQWLTMLLADWPPAERCEFARLLTRFADGICHHLDDLDI